jgi:hypothetical protein
LPGRSYLEKLKAGGFHGAEIRGPTGYVTSRFTAAYYVTAVK